MSTQKSKFELYRRLQDMGFTYEEAFALRRIEMTLSRWSEMECGNDRGQMIERDETTGRPYMTYDSGSNGKRARYPIADRESGALKRLNVIMQKHPLLWSYHQGDPRGCSLYVGKLDELPSMTDADLIRFQGPNAVNTSERRLNSILEMYYTRGLAVCA